MNKTLNCLQIGIQMFAEYTYLVGCPDSRDEIIWKPTGYSSSDEWHYYGVDGDPICVLGWHNKRIPKTTWINTYLDQSPGLVKSEDIVDMFYEHQNQVNHNNFFVGKITLSQLIRDLNLEHIEILVMDIEGSELPVFLEYDWHVKPKYLIVETHSESITCMLTQLFEKKEYRQVHKVPTNSGMTTELVYIDKEDYYPFFDCRSV